MKNRSRDGIAAKGLFEDLRYVCMYACMYVCMYVRDRPSGAYFVQEVDWVLVILSDPLLGPSMAAIASVVQPLLGVLFHIVLSAPLFCFK